MENYVEYTTMGVVSRIRMRPGCLPTKFACQPNRANISTDVCRPAAPLYLIILTKYEVL